MKLVRLGNYQDLRPFRPVRFGDLAGLFASQFSATCTLLRSVAFAKTSTFRKSSSRLRGCPVAFETPPSPPIFSRHLTSELRSLASLPLPPCPFLTSNPLLQSRGFSPATLSAPRHFASSNRIASTRWRSLDLVTLGVRSAPRRSLRAPSGSCSASPPSLRSAPSLAALRFSVIAAGLIPSTTAPRSTRRTCGSTRSNNSPVAPTVRTRPSSVNTLTSSPARFRSSRIHWFAPKSSKPSTSSAHRSRIRSSKPASATNTPPSVPPVANHSASAPKPAQSPVSLRSCAKTKTKTFASPRLPRLATLRIPPPSLVSQPPSKIATPRCNMSACNRCAQSPARSMAATLKPGDKSPPARPRPSRPPRRSPNASATSRDSSARLLASQPSLQRRLLSLPQPSHLVAADLCAASTARLEKNHPGHINSLLAPASRPSHQTPLSVELRAARARYPFGWAQKLRFAPRDLSCASRYHALDASIERLPVARRIVWAVRTGEALATRSSGNSSGKPDRGFVPRVAEPPSCQSQPLIDIPVCCRVRRGTFLA